MRKVVFKDVNNNKLYYQYNLSEVCQKQQELRKFVSNGDVDTI